MSINLYLSPIFLAHRGTPRHTKELGELSFLDYYKQIARKRKGSNYDNWMAAYQYLETFVDKGLKFANLNEKLINEFKEYLLTTQSYKRKNTKLSQNTALAYFNKVKATLKQAFKDGYLQYDLNGRIPSIKEAETRREYLTLTELNKLVKTTL